MIKSLEINALKSIKKLSIKCTNLNIFAGTNSSGKSSIMQALLIASQYITTNGQNGLNGYWLKLGDFKSVKSLYCKNDEISIQITDDTYDEVLDLHIKDNASMHGINISYEPYEVTKKNLYELFSYKKNFFYIPFDRIGVQDTFNKNLEQESRFGKKCEYAISYLEAQKDEVEKNSIAPELIIDKNNKTLLAQVNYWFKDIVGATVDTESIDSQRIKVNYVIADGIKHTPINVGSGISYLISILIVCLASEKNSTILIENPEIHLHPKAQAKLMKFLYFIAASGRQLFIETHSDHIFNGIRAGISTNEMDPSKIAVNFVTCNETEGSQNSVIQFGKMGNIENPIPDLFDQFELDINKMIGL